ncbi:CcdC protein domain-containing protein [Paenibacillus xanthanilyticus]|uniref:CcdC protein domain-containing protein n=1 Tax=Paenibacillus xanthanilyticus TaxID=1783531 RepID=A0ABV8K712_9BACL
MKWFNRTNKPVTRGGLWILLPVAIVPILFTFTLYQLRHVPGRPFHLPAYWELAIAMALGLAFGVVMLVQTAYEKREDGLIYPKSNKNFKYVLLGIIVVRVALSEYFRTLDQTVFTVLAMVLALTYLFVWRIGSFMKVRRLLRPDEVPAASEDAA